MNRKKVSILVFVLVILITLLFILVFKVVATSESGRAEKCVPYNVEIKKAEKDFQVEISWLTKDLCTGFVLYGKDRNNMNLIVVENSGNYNSRDHRVVIDGLLTYKRYYFLINSDSQDYGISGSPLSFTINSL